MPQLATPFSPKGISIDRLRGDGLSFARLTFPRYRPLLAAGNEGIVAFAASSGLKPVGLALATYTAPQDAARLLSLVVDSPEQRMGVGSALLRACEAALAEAGCKEVVAFHSSRLPAASAFQATLRSGGWQEPELLELRCAGRSGAFAAAIAEWPGVQRLLRNPAYSFTTWDGVTLADAPAIERLCAEPACSPYLSPRTWEGLLEAKASTAVRRWGELVGWVLARRDPESAELAFQCECAYIQQDLWRTGALVAAYHHGYRSVAEHFGAEAIVRFSTVPRLAGMMALTRRRFAPVALWVDEWLVSRKILSR